MNNYESIDNRLSILEDYVGIEEDVVPYSKALEKRKNLDLEALEKKGLRY